MMKKSFDYGSKILKLKSKKDSSDVAQRVM